MSDTSPDTGGAPPLTRYLRFTRPMMRGEDVLWLQSRLQAGGWPAGVAGLVRSADGLFGPRTEEAVRAFQRLFGLTVDGIVGPETWGRLALGPRLGGDEVAQRRRVAEVCREVEAGLAPSRHLEPDRLRALGEWHARFGGGTPWRLGRAGVELRDGGVVAAGAEFDAKAEAVLRDWFPTQIQAAATKHGVPVELIAACLCTESAGAASGPGQCAGMERREPGFRSTAATPHRVFIGCMQTSLSAACGALGRPVQPEELRRPEVSIAAGTAYIAQQAGRTLLDPPVVACAYNAGGVRYDPSPGNRWRMVQHPIGTGHHADRFIAWFNACLRLLGREPGLAGEAPSVAAALPRMGE